MKRGMAILLSVKTTYQHNDLSDRGPDGAKSTIRSILDRFLGDNTPPGTVEAEKLQNDPGLLAAVAIGWDSPYMRR
jgi:hypothetical protein